MPEPTRSPLREAILDRAKAHMSAHEMRSIEVAEWNCTIHWTPMTLRERETIRRRAASHGFADAQAHIIFLKAVDRDGQKIFDLDDKRVLLDQADSTVVTRIAGAISDDQPLEDQVAAAEKNSEGTAGDA